jgi:hypothetical protein
VKFNPQVVARTSIDDRSEQRPRHHPQARPLCCARRGAFAACGAPRFSLGQGFPTRVVLRPKHCRPVRFTCSHPSGVNVGGDAHITHQHVRKTSLIRFPHSALFRHGLSIIFWRQISAGISVAPNLTEIRCFPSPSKTPATRQKTVTH